MEKLTVALPNQPTNLQGHRIRLCSGHKTSQSDPGFYYYINMNMCNLEFLNYLSSSLSHSHILKIIFQGFKKNGNSQHGVTFLGCHLISFKLYLICLTLKKNKKQYRVSKKSGYMIYFCIINNVNQKSVHRKVDYPKSVLSSPWRGEVLFLQNK